MEDYSDADGTVFGTDYMDSHDEGTDTKSGSGGGGLNLGQLAGTLLGGLLGNKGQKDANETNMALGREQMAFQERMSGSAYQRAMEDMRKAGLNPMLAANVGGASTPSGALPQVQNQMSPAVASAQQAMQAMATAQQIDQSKAQEDEIRTSIEKIRSETLDRNLNTAARAAQIEKDKGAASSARATASKTSEEILGARYDSQGKQMGYRANRGDKELDGTGWAADVAKRKAEAKSAQYKTSGDKAYSDFYETPYGHAQPYMDSVEGIARGISSAAQAVRPRVTNIYQRR